MSREYEIGIVTRAEKAEAEMAALRLQLVKVEADRDRYLGERNQLLNHLANEVDAA